MSQGEGGGRPLRVFSEAETAEVETLASVLSQDQLADYFSISRTLFYEIRKRQPEVSERYKKGKARAIGSVATGLLARAREGDTTSAIFYLKTQAGWRETQNVNHQSDDRSMSPIPESADPNDLRKARELIYGPAKKD